MNSLEDRACTLACRHGSSTKNSHFGNLFCFTCVPWRAETNVDPLLRCDCIFALLNRRVRLHLPPNESDLSSVLISLPTLSLCACPLSFSVEIWRFCATLKHEYEVRTLTEHTSVSTMRWQLQTKLESRRPILRTDQFLPRSRSDRLPNLEDEQSTQE